MIKYQHLGPVSTIIWFPRLVAGAFQVALVVKNPPANAGDLRDSSWIPGLGIFPGEGNVYRPQYSCLENFFATHGVSMEFSWPEYWSG